jgi:exodeoxyribonuclease VII large subunit
MRRYSVKQLTEELHQLLAARYPLLEVEGEISQLATPSSGHAYLTLRDDEAILAAVVWRATWLALDHRPRLGDRVVCRGKLGVFPGKGAHQLYIHHIAPAGQGALAVEIARRKARLEADGLLDPRRKRPLPRFPRVIGVATSLTGAALQDFLKVSRERHPATRVLVAGCTVQGAMAPASVVQAIDLLIEDGRSEIIIVTRGGGSKEDLLAFQDEGLARYLAHCPVPVISAVGHQVDTTLADLVADAVAPTPSAAAVLALPDGQALAQRVDDAAMALGAAMGRRLARRRERVEALRARLRHPGDRLREIRRRARDLAVRLERVLADRLRTDRRRVQPLADRMGLAAARLVPRRRETVEGLQRRLDRAMATVIERRRSRVIATLQRAEALSPQAVLSRGYAVVTGPGGVVTRATEVAPRSEVRVRVHRGAFTAVVSAVEAGPSGQDAP